MVRDCPADLVQGRRWREGEIRGAKRRPGRPQEAPKSPQVRPKRFPRGEKEKQRGKGRAKKKHRKS